MSERVAAGTLPIAGEPRLDRVEHVIEDTARLRRDDEETEMYLSTNTDAYELIKVVKVAVLVRPN